MVGHGTGPDSVSEDADSLGAVSHDGPHAGSVRSLGSAVEEVTNKDVLSAVAHRLLLAGLHRPQMHVGLQVSNLVDHNALESVVSGQLGEGVLFEGAAGHNGALVVDLVHGVAEAVELSHFSALEASVSAGFKSGGLAMAIFRHADVGVQALEHTLDLFEDGLQAVSGCGKLTEHVVLAVAPEEAALEETRMSVAVSANRNEVVLVETCNRNCQYKLRTYR